MVKRKTVQVKDLKNQIGKSEPLPILKCFVCGGEYSANSGDYFATNPDHVFTCCGRNTALVRRQVKFEPA